MALSSALAHPHIATTCVAILYSSFRDDVTRLEVPYYMLLGEHEARGRAVLAEEWFDMVQAPAKTRFVFESSGHRPNFDRPADFVELISQVLDDTGPQS